MAKVKTIGPGPWCGKPGGYTNHGCRCDECKLAWRIAARSGRAARVAALKADPDLLPPEMHGSISTYTNWGCNCEKCTEAWRTKNDE